MRPGVLRDPVSSFGDPTAMCAKLIRYAFLAPVLARRTQNLDLWHDFRANETQSLKRPGLMGPWALDRNRGLCCDRADARCP